VSNRKDKIAARAAEQQEFLRERRQVQLAVFESNFKVGLDLFESSKDKMSPEEIAEIEAEIEKNRKLIDDWKAQWGE
jgi:hypothetical protein